MILKMKYEIKDDDIKVEELLEGFTFTDHISYVKIEDGGLIGGWDNKEGRWEDPLKIKDYEKIYLLNDDGKTIERIK